MVKIKLENMANPMSLENFPDFKPPHLAYLSLSGGWGYDRESVFIIRARTDGPDPVESKALASDAYVGFEYAFCDFRLEQEGLLPGSTIGSLFNVEKVLNIQGYIKQDGRHFDRLVYDVSGLAPLEALKWATGVKDPSEGADPDYFSAYDPRQRDSLAQTCQREYWFDITEFF